MVIYSSPSFFESSDEDWQRQYEVNVRSGVRLTRHFLPQMLDRNWGRILFVSSECATLVPADLIAYSTTKAAILAVSRGLAQLTKGTRVTVNSFIPGSTMTEGAEQFLASLALKENKSVDKAEEDFFKNIHNIRHLYKACNRIWTKSLWWIIGRIRNLFIKYLI